MNSDRRATWSSAIRGAARRIGARSPTGSAARRDALCADEWAFQRRPQPGMRVASIGRMPHRTPALSSPAARRNDVAARALRAAFAGAALVLVACSSPASDSLAKDSPGTVRSADPTAFPNDKAAYDYFRGKGFTNFQAAGIVGNLDQESGIDPTISQQNGGPGRGIAQWSAGGRWDSDPGDNLVDFANKAGQSPTSLQVQLDFIMFELQTFSDYGLAKLQASTTIEDATSEFELGFEGCGIPAQCDADARLNYAKSVFAAYGNDPAPDAGSAGGDAAGDDDASGGGDDDSSAPVSGESDAGAHSTADAATATPATDAAANGGGSNNASPASSGCAIGARGTAPSTRWGWVALVGLALAMRRRRSASRESL